jgi:4-amino-4-deoxy-L-arabinose transferase-like glycosyltransferase
VATFGGRGEYSVWGAFEEHVLNRAIHGMHHRQPPWYYLEILPLQLLPWGFLLPGAFVLAWRRRREPADRLLLAWTLFVVGLFSLSTEKRDLYVLPAYPALALMFARLVRAADGPAGSGGGSSPAMSRKWVTVPLALAGCALAISALGVPLAAKRFPGFPPGPLIAVGAVAVASGIVVVAAALRRRVLAAAVVTAGAASVLFLSAATVLFPAMNPLRSARTFAEEVRDLSAASRAAGKPVLAYGVGNLPEAIAFYSNGVYTRETLEIGELASHLMDDAEVFAVAERSRLGLLPAAALERVEVLRTAGLASKPIVLISNRRRT